ncbi:MAG TPA: hypothetical protein DDY43_13555 [Synechococcales bacterium UBA10510]|nr:hypothetical protein [Synechococcales bacterium UBA10510]
MPAASESTANHDRDEQLHTNQPSPLVTREALRAFTQRLVEQFAPEQVILFGSQARGKARWDSDADILVVLPFEGRPLDTVKAMRSACEPEFPLDLHLRRPEEIEPRYLWGDPFIREAIDYGDVLYGQLLCGQPNHDQIRPASESHPARNPVVQEWIERAERHWGMVELSADLQGTDLIGLFYAEMCLETYLRAALIAQGVQSRKCRDLQILSSRLREPIPGWQADSFTLNTLTQAALAYLDPGGANPEPTQDLAWAVAHAGPLRDCLRCWFDSLEPSP